MAIVADFESYPQWNDEVKAVYTLARDDDGRPGQRRCSRTNRTALALVSPSCLLAIAPYFPTKEVRIKLGTVQLQI